MAVVPIVCFLLCPSMNGLRTFLIALLAALGAMMVHHNLHQPDSFGFGMGVFALVGALLLYWMFFWRE
jgi:hypothetical protein